MTKLIEIFKKHFEMAYDKYITVENENVQNLMDLYKAKTNVLKCDFIRGQDQDSVSNPDFEE